MDYIFFSDTAQLASEVEQQVQEGRKEGRKTHGQERKAQSQLGGATSPLTTDSSPRAAAA